MTAEAVTAAELRALLTRAYAHLPADVWRGALGREIREALGNPLPSDGANVSAMLGAGMSVRDVADALRLHPSAVRAALPCLCREDATTRYEHPQCPRHVRRQ